MPASRTTTVTKPSSSTRTLRKRKAASPESGNDIPSSTKTAKKPRVEKQPKENPAKSAKTVTKANATSGKKASRSAGKSPQSQKLKVKDRSKEKEVINLISSPNPEEQCNGASTTSQNKPSKAATNKKSTTTATPTKASGSKSKNKSNNNKSAKDASYSSQVAEKRLRQFRPRAVASFSTVYDRAISQRMFAIQRKRGEQVLEIDNDKYEVYPTETVDIAGTTGNVYTVVIDRLPSCNCPHALKGNQCKHIIYVLKRILKAPYNLTYQLALLSSELHEIFANAPAIPSAIDSSPGSAPSSDNTNSDNNKNDADKATTLDSFADDPNRRPIDADTDCPICATEFSLEGDANTITREEIVYCRAACGNNIHKECFMTWAKTKGWRKGGKQKAVEVPCPFCRTPWQWGEEGHGDGQDAGEDGDGDGDGDGNMNISKEEIARMVESRRGGDGRAGAGQREGYINVAGALGISGRRDWTTYHQPWVRSRYARW